MTDRQTRALLETTCTLAEALLARGADDEATLDRLRVPLARFHREEPRFVNDAWRQLFGSSLPVSLARELDRATSSRTTQYFDEVRIGAAVFSGVIHPLAEGVLIACIGASDGDEMRDGFLSIVSHELRTPITTILLWEKVMRDDGLDAALHARALDAIHDSAMQQARLVGDLLDLSRASSGKLHVTLVTMPIREVVIAAIAAAEPSALARRQTLALHCDDELGCVRGDVDRLAQVLANVLANSIRQTPELGRIEVSARRSGDAVTIEISDNGCGISDEMLPSVFDPFRPGAIVDGGLGLGLAIARALVQAHGGSLSASSPGIGKGAMFTISLPSVAAVPRDERPSFV